MEHPGAKRNDSCEQYLNQMTVPKVQIIEPNSIDTRGQPLLRLSRALQLASFRVPHGTEKNRKTWFSGTCCLGLLPGKHFYPERQAQRFHGSLKSLDFYGCLMCFRHHVINYTMTPRSTQHLFKIKSRPEVRGFKPQNFGKKKGISSGCWHRAPANVVKRESTLRGQWSVYLLLGLTEPYWHLPGILPTLYYKVLDCRAAGGFSSNCWG